MRALVIGASGLVGGALLCALGPNAVGTYRTRERPGLIHLDASDAGSVRQLLHWIEPDVIFFPAAEPNVEWCEAHPDEARRRNVRPLEVTLAEAGQARLVGFSSDYVFDGAHGPYTENAARRPLSVYGRIKVELEDAIIAAGGSVVRTTTVFGPESAPPKNFVLRLVAALERGESVSVPNDQLSTPTYSLDLADAVVHIAASGDDARGIWHVAGPDLMARDELARLVADAFGFDRRRIRPVPTAALGQRAARPLRGGLRSERYERAFGLSLRPVRDALADMRTVLTR